MLRGDDALDTQWTAKLYHLCIAYLETRFAKQSMRCCNCHFTASMITLRWLTSQMMACHASFEKRMSLANISNTGQFNAWLIGIRFIPVNKCTYQCPYIFLSVWDRNAYMCVIKQGLMNSRLLLFPPVRGAFFLLYYNPMPNKLVLGRDCSQSARQLWYFADIIYKYWQILSFMTFCADQVVIDQQLFK